MGAYSYTVSEEIKEKIDPRLLGEFRGVQNMDEVFPIIVDVEEGTTIDGLVGKGTILTGHAKTIPEIYNIAARKEVVYVSYSHQSHHPVLPEQ